MRVWAWLRSLLGLEAKEARHGAIPVAQVVQRVKELQAANAQWPEIWQTLNPNGDSQVQNLLIELRGPHMFAPHLALNVLEEACLRVMVVDSNADLVAALRAALKSGDPFVRPD
jgi:hypothetical protein